MYGYKKQITGPFDEAVNKTKAALKKEGFGILTEINVQATLKTKLNVDFDKYVILGACNPPYAHKALQAEKEIGLMLPCNVIVQDIGEGNIEVSAVNPVASMESVKNDLLFEVAVNVKAKLESAVDAV